MKYHLRWVLKGGFTGIPKQRRGNKKKTILNKGLEESQGRGSQETQ